jgi:hypothetical protein
MMPCFGLGAKRILNATGRCAGASGLAMSSAGAFSLKLLVMLSLADQNNRKLAKLGSPPQFGIAEMPTRGPFSGGLINAVVL